MTDGIQRLDQGPAQWSKRILHFRRDDRMNFARDQPVSFQAAQSLGEHLLRYSSDLSLEHGIAARPGGEDVNNQRGPFIRDPAEDHARETMRIHDGRLGALRHLVSKRIRRHVQSESDKPTGGYGPRLGACMNLRLENMIIQQSSSPTRSPGTRNQQPPG